ncbi:hypothetical protein [Blastococcus atacamensis]|uniref:hypothetical protein n=1 Tax=Blastococcus atacamensis TaxID=2070508 RepID=UPI0012FFE6BD|nr:hypothetical protein [Blastococcus atacamensis]
MPNAAPPLPRAARRRVTDPASPSVHRSTPPFVPTSSAQPAAPWRWRRRIGAGSATYQATPPGPLGDDGGLVVIARQQPVNLPCLTCGRAALTWRAVLELPAPFPRTLPGHGSGCSRNHAASTVPTRWDAVAQVLHHAAAQLREDREPSLWHEQLAEQRTREADRAQWLAGQPSPARQLALRLWIDDGLTVTDTEIIVEAVLADRSHAARGRSVAGTP